MTTVGYGDIVCISSIERIYHIILLVLGTLLYSFLVSKIGNYLRDESHENIKLSKDLNTLENIRITNPTMSFKLYTKIKNHLLSIFNKRKKTGISLLINGVPDAIKIDLLFKIYAKVINEFNIFKDVKNSNFVLQVLTKFIPILSKKEEIIILEGEYIENIVFVKDGRLSIQIILDLNHPYESIQKYVEVNLNDITQEKEANNMNYKDNSVMLIPKRDYNDLKVEIDNVLQFNKKTLINNSCVNDNGISVDLGRLEFSRSEVENMDYNNAQIIKIIDIRKNEHYGDVHMLMEKPSPFTLKTKSRLAELLLLRKHDVLIISKNFQNIFKRIQNKSYHNLVSIKKLTFKTLKRYYNSHLFNKNNRENKTLLNLDMTTNSILPDKQIFSKKIKGGNNSNILDSSQLKSSNINKNKLYIGYGKNHKISNNDKLNIDDELDLTSSFDSKSNSYSHSKDENSIKNQNNKKYDFIPIIKDQEVENDKNDFSQIKNIKDFTTFKMKEEKRFEKFLKRKSMDNITFKNDIKFSSPKKILTINNSNPKKALDSISILNLNNSQDNNSKNQINKNLSKKSSFNETIKYNNEITKDVNNEINIITLENINPDFSQKIKKQIKKKKIQKNERIIKITN